MKPKTPAYSALHTKLKARQEKARKSLQTKHPHALSFFEQKGFDLGKIREHSARLLTAGAISGSLLLPSGNLNGNTDQEYPPPKLAISSPTIFEDGIKNKEYSVVDQKGRVIPTPFAQLLVDREAMVPDAPKEWLQGQMSSLLPPINNRLGWPFLDLSQEKAVEQAITRATQIPTKATLEGEHLNTTYGYIGAEQHLARYPGDTITNHDMQTEGMAPGLGGWRYFTENGALTKEGIMREKYYVAIQIMYLHDWKTRQKELSGWYKWRKIIVVDTATGNAVVAVVGDAGPAAWTGKHFGGSPEVMDALGGQRYKKGKVVMMFVDDPENKIPLGPVEYKNAQEPVLQSI